MMNDGMFAGSNNAAGEPSNAMRQAAAQRLGCGVADLRFSEVGPQVPGAFSSRSARALARRAC